MDRPPPRPEGRLIALTLKRRGLSVRAAAKQVPISDSRLRQIINGYETPRRDVCLPVIAPAGKLALIALAFGITPGQLEEAERADAASELRELRKQPPLADAPRGSGNDRPAPAWDIAEARAGMLAISEEIGELGARVQEIAKRLEEIERRAEEGDG
jgi:transcriptional regulator with XRE-family HTH domain